MIFGLKRVKPMTDQDFEVAYDKALQYQAAGDIKGITSLIEQVAAQGAPEDALAMLGALAESTLQFPGTRGPA
jgi:hypothetical protein